MLVLPEDVKNSSFHFVRNHFIERFKFSISDLPIRYRLSSFPDQSAIDKNIPEGTISFFNNNPFLASLLIHPYCRIITYIKRIPCICYPSPSNLSFKLRKLIKTFSYY